MKKRAKSTVIVRVEGTTQRQVMLLSLLFSGAQLISKGKKVKMLLHRYEKGTIAKIDYSSLV
jgi:hypothetical protein